jgi:general secretion pathway protein K
VELLDKVIEGLPGTADGNLYDAEELAHDLMDYVDADDAGLRGGLEDDVYQSQDPPYRAANRPLLSLDELRLVDGFDGRLVEALRPYVTVHPWARGDGINPNTAPPWVLALLYHGTSGDYRFADESAVRRVLDIREHDGILCAADATDPRCTPLGEAVPGEVFPPPSFVAEVFQLTAVARMGEVEREVFAVVDRSDAAEPVLLAWQVR